MGHYELASDPHYAFQKIFLVQSNIKIAIYVHENVCNEVYLHTQPVT